MTRVALAVAGIQVRDVLRSRWILVYTSFFLLLSEGLLRFSGDETKAVLSLATASLMIIPLATLVLATIYVYTAREFTELLLAQPIRRSSLFAGLYAGLALPAASGFLVGVTVPFLLRGGADPALRGAFATLLLVGTALTFAFTAIAFCVALRTEDRLRGVGVALGIWLLVAVAYDGIVLTAVMLLERLPTRTADARFDVRQSGRPGSRALAHAPRRVGAARLHGRGVRAVFHASLRSMARRGNAPVLDRGARRRRSTLVQTKGFLEFKHSTRPTDHAEQSYCTSCVPPPDDNRVGGRPPRLCCVRRRTKSRD